MSIEDRVMKLGCPVMVAGVRFIDREEAATISKEADELMAEMARALRAFSHYPKIGKLCEEYDNWKEATK